MMPHAKPKPESGFTPIELPIALLFLGVLGVLVAFLVHHFGRPLPWYAWPLSFLSLPVVAAAISLFFFWRDERRSPGPPRPPERLRRRRDGNRRANYRTTGRFGEDMECEYMTILKPNALQRGGALGSFEKPRIVLCCSSRVVEF